MSNEIVKSKFHGEHHMGAETVELILPFELEGYSHLFSTNGSVGKSADARFLYLKDATVVLKVNVENHSVEYFQPPNGKYISAFEESSDGYRMEIYGNYSRPKEQLLSKAEVIFKPGLGPVKNGLFPSAHEPHVNSIKNENT
ncbi:hypothetical protein NBRC116493_36050 [Aurantivibrio infirmus]